MFETKTTPVIIYFDRNRLQLYHSSLGTVPGLDLTANIIKDLVIVDQAGFTSQILNFVQQQKLDPTPVGIILAETVYFEKNLPSLTDYQTEAQSFFDQVPFNAVQKKVYTLTKEVRAVAVNKELLDSLIGAVEQQGFRVDFVLPAFLLELLAGKRWLDQETGEYVTKNFLTLKKLNLLLTEQSPASSDQETSFAPKPRTLKWTLPVFLLLMAILLALLFRG